MGSYMLKQYSEQIAHVEADIGKCKRAWTTVMLNQYKSIVSKATEAKKLKDKKKIVEAASNLIGICGVFLQVHSTLFGDHFYCRDSVLEILGKQHEAKKQAGRSRAPAPANTRSKQPTNPKMGHRGVRKQPLRKYPDVAQPYRMVQSTR